jgi:hypothetical protein
MFKCIVFNILEKYPNLETGIISVSQMEEWKKQNDSLNIALKYVIKFL